VEESTNIPLIQVSCDMCGASSSDFLFKKNGLTGVRCAACGLVYINPRPTDEFLKSDIYNEGYFNAEKGYGIEDLHGKGREEALKRSDALFNEIEKSASPGAVLDIGCAAGFFLETARRRGWSPQGVEISDYAACHARDNLSLDVSTGDFVTLELPTDKFDLVLMMDVIEHLTSPKKGLQKVNNVLKSGGLLVIETPNFDSAPAKVLGVEWGLIAPEHHLFYFTPTTLKKMLEATGFEIVSMTFPRWGLTDLLLSAGSLRKAGLPIGEKEKRFVRRSLRGPRDAVRAAADIIDRRLLAQFLGNKQGVTIKITAKKKI
jgi:2-polyprenyl-3-methyl-5-hydroxy-6-metoxy-1,4-benzoquinol methylase